MVIVDDGQDRPNVDVSLDYRERHGPVFEVVSGGGDPTDQVAPRPDWVGRLNKDGIRTVQVEPHESPRRVPDVVNLGHRFLPRVTPFGQMDGGSEPIEFMREGSIIDFRHRWASSDNAQGVDEVCVDNIDARFFPGGQ